MIDHNWSIFVALLICSSAKAVILKTEPTAADNSTAPEQIHLSWDGDGTRMIVTWNTVLSTSSIVQYGKSRDELMTVAFGIESKFVDVGLRRRTQYVHRATMTDLGERALYYYRVGNDEKWSEVYSFRSLKSGADWSPRLAVYGDFGLENSQSLRRLTRLVDKGQIDLVMHVGDFAYDMNNDEGRVGDAFMRMIQPVAARVPYQTVVGNHENFWNFTQYKNRFTMPGSENGLFYTFAIGPANFIILSTEFYFFVEYGFWQIPRQFGWLEDQLKRLNNLASRKERPWIITFGHRPMYCSNDDRDDCTKYESIIRTGVPGLHVWALEKLFNTHGVDLSIWAHEHSYERLYPVYDRKVYNGTDSDNPYHNPGALVHVISGSAGCKEKTDPFINPMPWSAVRNSDYGFLKMHIINRTHINVKQVNDEKGGAVIDSFTIVKEERAVYGRSWVDG